MQIKEYVGELKNMPANRKMSVMDECITAHTAAFPVEDSSVYRAVFFDLDGTLLPMELDGFMRSYFQSLGSYVAHFGVSGDCFMAGMKAGIKAMAAHDGDRLNADAFWGGYFTHIDPEMCDWKTELDGYYEHEFGKLGAQVKPNPSAARAVETLAAKGYPLVLATMPMFPQRAVEWRLEWAGVDPAYFSRLTTFVNSTSVKPKLSYYAENLAAAGVVGSDVLMVGNNTKEDLAIRKLGADAYLVTDLLIDPVGFDITGVEHGSLDSFAAWVDHLPACANPAANIQAGLVPSALRQSVLADHGGEAALAHDAQASASGFSINGIEG